MAGDVTSGGIRDEDQLLTVTDLSLRFVTRTGFVQAVDRVSLTVSRSGSLGIVGESGSGKSSLGYALMRVLPPNASVSGGSVVFQGTDLLKLTDEEIRRDVRWKGLAMIFQNAMTALNPVFTIGRQLTSALRLHVDMPEAAARSQAAEMLELVGMDRAWLDSFPHQLSGGMRQRAMVALALICKPRLVIADEPTTALDVIAQDQVLDQLQGLKEEFGLALIFVSHDLGVVANHCRDLAVMYAGQIVETGPTTSLVSDPKHPYTMALLRSFPSLRDPQPLLGIAGSPPDLSAPPPGCRFHPRCPFAQEVCRVEEPPVVILDGGHSARCHFAGQLTLAALEEIADVSR